MSDPKRHHYIQQSILEHFLPDGEVLFYCYNKLKNRTHPSTPRDMFFEYELNTDTNWLGENSKSMEFELGHFESEICNLVERLVERAREGRFFLNPEEKELWTKFLFVQFARHPERLEGLRRTLKDVVKSLPRVRPDGVLINPTVRQYYQNPENPENQDVLRKVFLSLIFDHAAYARFKPIFDSKEVYAIIIDIPEKSFVLGNKSITRWPKGNSDLRGPNTRLFFPVRPDVIIAWGDTTAKHKVDMVNREGIRTINELTLFQSECIVGRNKALIESLALRMKRCQRSHPS
ncbi:MAG: DUF4238 domain-containing protein [Bacteroidota bacterium]|nr:DUF4238 domain-containing protein [Bacteroidota bacterium]